MSYRRKQEDKRRAQQRVINKSHIYCGTILRKDGAYIRWSRSDCWNTKDFKRRAAKAVRKTECGSGKMYRKIHDWYYYY